MFLQRVIFLRVAFWLRGCAWQVLALGANSEMLTCAQDAHLCAGSLSVLVRELKLTGATGKIAVDCFALRRAYSSERLTWQSTSTR